MAFVIGAFWTWAAPLWCFLNAFFDSLLKKEERWQVRLNYKTKAIKIPLGSDACLS